MRGEGWTERILDCIDSATVAVAMGTVHWTDGTRFDVRAVPERTSAVGAALILDGTQTVGAVPIDVKALDPDALIVAAYKWLLGPYSLSLAWFGECYLDGVPLEEAWIGRRGSENFAGLVDYVDEYQPGALRFDVGQRSNFALMPAVCGHGAPEGESGATPGGGVVPRQQRAGVTQRVQHRRRRGGAGGGGLGGGAGLLARNALDTWHVWV